MLNKFAFVLLLTAVTFNIFAQCSDAGVCVIGRHPINEFVIKKNIISLGYIYGSSGKDADANGNSNDIAYGTLKIEGDFEIAKDLRVNASFPYTLVSGPLGENNGIGDLAVTFSKIIKIKKKNLFQSM